MAQNLKKEPKLPLPVDHGQFGRSDATEDYKPLASPPGAGAPDGKDASVMGNTD